MTSTTPYVDEFTVWAVPNMLCVDGSERRNGELSSKSSCLLTD